MDSSDGKIGIENMNVPGSTTGVSKAAGPIFSEPANNRALDRSPPC